MLLLLYWTDDRISEEESSEDGEGFDRAELTPGGVVCRETVGTVSERELAPAMTCGMSDLSSDVDVSLTRITPHKPKTEPELEKHSDIKPGES